MPRLPRSVVPADAIRVAWRLPKPLRAAARAFAEALLADGETPPPPDRLDWALDELDDFLGHAGVRARRTFEASMVAVSTLAPLSIGRPLPLGALAIGDRQRAIERFERTPLGISVLGAKAMLCICYYEHPDAAAEIGADGLCMEDLS